MLRVKNGLRDQEPMESAVPTLDPDFAALLSAPQPDAPAATPAASGPMLDPDFAALAQAPAKSAAPVQSPNALGPWASAVVRPLAKAAVGLPLMAADAGITAGNYLRNLPQTKSVSSPENDQFLAGLGITPNAGGPNKLERDMPLMQPTFDSLLDKYTTAPQGIGKGAEFVNTAIASARLPMPGIANPAPAAFTKAPLTAPSGLTGAQQQAATQGADIGMRLTPGQQMGSKALQQVEAKLESQPWTSGPITAIKSGNQEALNRTAADAIGENSPVVDSTVLGRANDRIGGVFESVRTPDRVLTVDPKATAGTLEKIDGDFEGLIPGKVSENPLVARLKTLTDSGEVNGEQLGSISSKLGKAAYKQMTSAQGDRDLGEALYAVKNHVDDLVQATLKGDEATKFALARQQYRALMQLTSRVGTVNPSTGNVSGGALANYLQQTDKKGFLFGKNTSPLYSAARFAQAFKPIVGDSGTATRSPNLFNPIEIAAGIPANLATRFYLSRPGQAMIRGGMQLPGQIAPSVRPGLLGGLLAAQTSEAGQ